MRDAHQCKHKIPSGILQEKTALEGKKASYCGAEKIRNPSVVQKYRGGHTGGTKRCEYTRGTWKYETVGVHFRLFGKNRVTAGLVGAFRL